MATTTKTLTPTNQTITLPDMTERPNASILVDGIGKDADAINALSDQMAQKFKLISSGSMHDIAGQTGIFWLTSGVSDKPEPRGGMLIFCSYNNIYCAGIYVVADDGKMYSVSFANNEWTYGPIAFAS